MRPSEVVIALRNAVPSSLTLSTSPRNAGPISLRKARNCGGVTERSKTTVEISIPRSPGPVSSAACIIAKFGTDTIRFVQERRFQSAVDEIPSRNSVTCSDIIGALLAWESFHQWREIQGGRVGRNPVLCGCRLRRFRARRGLCLDLMLSGSTTPNGTVRVFALACGEVSETRDWSSDFAGSCAGRISRRCSRKRSQGFRTRSVTSSSGPFRSARRSRSTSFVPVLKNIHLKLLRRIGSLASAIGF
jgi:hypothetical protein